MVFTKQLNGTMGNGYRCCSSFFVKGKRDIILCDRTGKQIWRKCKMDELNMMLEKSCNEMKKYSIENCYRDYVDNDNSCCWYHSAWQYLRLLDCVSAPQWHDAFYRNEFIDIAKKNGGNYMVKVLISGTADYSLLHLLIDAFFQLYNQEGMQVNSRIYVLDKCPTPISMCLLYPEYVAQFNWKKIEYIRKHIQIIPCNNDIFLYREGNFDLICTDAFLTRFSEENVKSVLNAWKNMLRVEGIIVTTIREHDNIENKNLILASKDIRKFEKKVLDRYKTYIVKNGQFPITEEELVFLANRYIIRMVSNNIGNQENIVLMFKKEGFEVAYDCKEVQGEISKTNYIHIKARRK